MSVIVKKYDLGSGAFAVPLADGKMLVGFGDVVAPSPSLILDADQLNALTHALNTEAELADDFGK